MLKLKTGYLKYFVCVILFSYTACSTNITKNSRRSMIPGLWRTEKVKENFKVSDTSVKNAVEDARNTIFLFNDDMTAEIRVRNISNTAKWNLDGDWLILKRDDDQLKFRLININSNRMTLVIKYPTGDLTYLLTRINTIRH